MDSSMGDGIRVTRILNVDRTKRELKLSYQYLNSTLKNDLKHSF